MCIKKSILYADDKMVLYTFVSSSCHKPKYCLQKKITASPYKIEFFLALFHIWIAKFCIGVTYIFTLSIFNKNQAQICSSYEKLMYSRIFFISTGYAKVMDTWDMHNSTTRCKSQKRSFYSKGFLQSKDFLHVHFVTY
jgi:hypothetical protein